MNDSLLIRPIKTKDKDWLLTLLRAQFGSEQVALRGKIVNAFDFPGFVACLEGENVGVVIYENQSESIEIIALVSIRPKQGVGATLISRIKDEAKKQGKKQITVITTNDNTHALRFYQKHGFVLTRIFANSVVALRVLKPEIPKLGNDGIPIRDEIELQIAL